MRALVPLLAVLALSAFALSGCDTAEERAEAHYQRALALLADGDADRAKVEFRNVFRLDGAHVAARLAYAAELDREGETREAYGQYLRVVDQDPKNLEALPGADRAGAQGAGLRHRRRERRHGLCPRAAGPRDPRLEGDRRLPGRQHRRGGGHGAVRGRGEPEDRGGADGADRRPARRRPGRRGAGHDRRGARPGPGRRKPSPRAPAHPRGAGRHRGRGRRARGAWSRSFPPRRGCAGR